MTAQVVTVFGGSGFIGRTLIKRLAKTGAVIRVPVRNPERAKVLKPMGDVGQITPFRIDIRSDHEIAAAIAGSDAVVNLIGILYERGASRFALAHAEAPARMAAAAHHAGVDRFVHVSAIGADPGSPSAYARSKAAGEAAVRAALPDAVILRPSIVFGPEDDFFNRFAALAQLLPALPLIGGGHTRFQPVYVGDVADAIMVALNDPGTAGKTFELGGPRVYSFKALMELLLSEIQRRRLLVPLPFGLAALQALFLELLPVPPLTRDQVKLLAHDTVVGTGSLTLRDLGITPTAVEPILPTYLDRFRPGGRFAPATRTR
ncbi:MAG TPA: complex I NDUFA9 subunit family protein [Candidatus Sulfotelmatobacter sp.]|nr:complex I NDUFA9 subunit family protein [Candidatus Sulfotelmatobacter sp.]